MKKSTLQWSCTCVDEINIGSGGYKSEVHRQWHTDRLYTPLSWAMLLTTWIEPMVVINSQPWGIVYWLVFKRLPVQTTYLFLQAFLKYFFSQEMLTTSEIKFKLHLILTLSVQLETIMTFYEENYGQNELNLSAWSDVHACLQTRWKWSHGSRTANHSLDIVPLQELSSILHFLNIFQSNKLC